MSRLHTLPLGYSEGFFDERRYGVTVSASDDGTRYKLYGEELGGSDVVSFNLYLLKRSATGQVEQVLRPCEMPTDKVMEFVLQYQPVEADAP